MLDVFWLICFGEGESVTQKWIIDDYYFIYIVAKGGKRLSIEKRNIKEAMTYCPLLFLVFHMRNLYFLFILEMENSFALFAVLRKL